MTHCRPQVGWMVVAAIAAAGLEIPALAAPQLSPPAQQSISSETPQLSAELRGDLAMARQQYVAAIQAYQEDPAVSAVIFNKIGMAYHHLFAMDSAKQNYLRALKLRPNYPEALNNLAAIYYARKQYHKAEKLYRKAIQLDPKSAAVYSNLGTNYFAEHKPELGIAALRTAFALDPRVFDANAGELVSESLPARDRAAQDYCLARLYAQSGHKDQALEYLRRALNEGFDDKKKLLEDQQLASLRATPEFAQLMIEQKLR